MVRLRYCLCIPGAFLGKEGRRGVEPSKGAIDPGEDELLAAIREFEEETGFTAEGEFIALTRLKQPSGKVISAWAVEGDCDPAAMTSTTFSMEWPPRSGTMAEFPETDRIEWFDIESAKSKIIRGQRGFIEEFEEFITRSYPLFVGPGDFFRGPVSAEKFGQQCVDLIL